MFKRNEVRNYSVMHQREIIKIRLQKNIFKIFKINYYKTDIYKFKKYIYLSNSYLFYINRALNPNNWAFNITRNYFLLWGLPIHNDTLPTSCNILPTLQHYPINEVTLPIDHNIFCIHIT